MQNVTVIEEKDFDVLKKEITELKALIEELATQVVHEPEWYTLKEACEKKGINHKTILNRTNLQPNQGIPEGKIGGRKKWSRETIKKWLPLTDEDIQKSLN